MGIAIPQVITPSKASGAQLIDGSLKFDGSSEYLKRTPSSSGDRRTYTFSCWIKRTKLVNCGSSGQEIFRAGDSALSAMNFAPSDGPCDALSFKADQGGVSPGSATNAVFRDFSTFFHVVYRIDTTQATAADRVRVYVNGVEQTWHTTNYPTQNQELKFNQSGQPHYIGGTEYFAGHMSQAYLIDGQSLGPENFGFTDPLTNTWKPKKYTGTFTGTNTFYLPFDGNSPIGKDQSGNGNDWTPVNFGGSVALDNPQVSGARPILNTTQGGTQAGVGVFGSKENKTYTVTYADDGGGNKYYIDGVKQATLTGLIRGATYTFNTVALGATHPFRLSATSAHGTEYTNGVKAVTGAATTITIPHNAPDTLYYYCTAHSGMGSSITGITTNAKLADQYASNCVLALPLVGVANDVSVSVACTSSTRAVSASGNAAAANESSNFYGGSFEFDGSGDYLDVTESDNCFDFGTGDFTIELWALLENNNDLIGTANNSAFLGSGKSGWVIRRFDEGIKFNYQSSGSWIFENTFGSEGARDKWNHIAITREGNKIRCFSNGVQQGSDYTNTTDITSTEGYCRIGGGYGSTSLLVDGYIQDVRIYKGVAKYTSDFVVPSPSPNILPDTPSGVANSSKLAKITSGAVRFDGSADHIIGGTSSDFSLGTGNFTIEGFIYPTNSSGTQGIMGIGNAVTPACQIFYNVSNSQKVRFNVTDGTAIESTGIAPVNAWSHFAVVREGTGSNETKVYINGKLEAQGTISTNLTETTLQIGRPNTSSGTEYFKGFISNFRVIKGTALYTSSFTPPTTPLTNVTNTKLLCCQSNISANLATVSPATFSNDGRFYSREMSFSPEVLSNVRGNDKAFTGQVPNNASSTSNNPASLTVSFSSNLTSVTSLRIFSGSNSSSAYINGASGSTVSITASSWTDLTSLATGASGTISSITVLTGGDNAQLAAVEVNGCILVDGIQGKALLRSGSGSAGPQVTSFNPFVNDIEAVRGQETEYCTMNPLSNAQGVTLSDGNLKCTWPSDGDGESVAGTIAIPMGIPGKFYWELDVTAGTGGGLDFGIVRSDQTSWMDGTQSNRLYNHPEFSGLLGNSGSIRSKTGTDSDVSNYLSATANGSRQTFMVCVDALEGKLWIGKDGVWGNNGGIGNPALGLNPGASNLYTDTSFSYLPVMMGASDSGTSTTFWNFGQKPFKFPPPDGFQPLNDANVRPAKVISRPDQYVSITTWTGDGNDNRNITLMDGFDLLWYKQRSSTQYHYLEDTIRGASRSLFSNANTGQSGVDSTKVKSFTKDGIVVGTDGAINQNTEKYVAWTWKAGGRKNTFNVDDVGYASASDAGLDGGSINPTGASVGTKQGFSMITITTPSAGAYTVSHGLTKAPDFIIYRIYDQAMSWYVWHQAYGAANKYMLLNSTTDTGSGTYVFNNTLPTASVITDYSSNSLHHNEGRAMLYYSWHDVPGLQKFGSYVANGAADGIFVELGFRPALVWIKSESFTNSYTNWDINDSVRDTYNPADATLAANLSDTENSGNIGTQKIDFLSNGFKIRQEPTSSSKNTDGETYIYCAWAEAPSVDLFGGGANAR